MHKLCLTHLALAPSCSTAASGNVVSFTSSRAPSLRGSGSLDGGNGKPAAAAGELVIKQRAKAAREAAASSRGECHALVQYCDVRLSM